MKLHFALTYLAETDQYLRLRIYNPDGRDLVYDMLPQQDRLAVSVDYFGKEIDYCFEVADRSGAVIRTDERRMLALQTAISECDIRDCWNEKSFPENFLSNKNLIIAKNKKRFRKNRWLKKNTHIFRLAAPLYRDDQSIVLLGDTEELGHWELHAAKVMQEVAPGIWELALTLPAGRTVKYRYGVRIESTAETIIEEGRNRQTAPAIDQMLVIQNDHRLQLNNNLFFRGAGVAVPVFSLRSADSFGVGDFLDLKLLADWASETGQRLIQILPINDTTTDYTWSDSYPYAAISVHALHPIYLRVDALSQPLPPESLGKYHQTQERLQHLPEVNYPEVIQEKLKFAREVFEQHRQKILRDRSFKSFFKQNEGWLKPYAVFCVMRDKYRTPDFSRWKSHRKYLAGKAESLFSENHKEYPAIMFHCWLQYELHLQLSDAVAYLHEKGIMLKGDLPIGIFRNSVDAWQYPHLFDTDYQTGAPPDAFSEIGQNWGFPTYRWEVMKKDDYAWWQSRFEVMDRYFDAIRIDHILGFFRIWKMPWDAMHGVLGHFDPAIGFSKEELISAVGISEPDRLTRPCLTKEIIQAAFDDDGSALQRYFNPETDGSYRLKPEIETQRKIISSPLVSSEADVHTLLKLSSEVLLIRTEESGQVQYHPRINLYQTECYKALTDEEKRGWYDLYQYYFYGRQNNLWKDTALERLRGVTAKTGMLVCGEDLGMVPAVVQEVMTELGVAALKVQRMPPPGEGEFYEPSHAGYLNVLTTSTHDTSTLRGWWEEDRGVAERFFHEQIHQMGTAPKRLHPLLAEIIISQNLYTDAMLAIFPLQDYLATRLKYHDMLQPSEERINIPSVYPHPWKYRMPITLEELLADADLTDLLRNMIQNSGRA